jgi:hypothetical protein
VLDLDKPGEKQALDFLRFATNRRNGIWCLWGMQRKDDALLCVVHWRRGKRAKQVFSLATVGLIQSEVRWRDFNTLAEARRAMAERGDKEPIPDQHTAEG